MLRKFIFTLLILILLSPSSTFSKSKYFFSFGFSEMYLNGSGNYQTYINQSPTGFLNTGSIDYSDTYSSLESYEVEIDLESSLKWNNNYVSILSLSGGYTFSKSNTVVLNISINIPKKGYLSTSSGSNIQWKNSDGTSSTNNTAYSIFKLLQVSIHNEHTIAKSLFLQTGINFSRFSTVSSTSNYSYNNNLFSGSALGFTTGLGYSKTLKQNKEIIIKTLYSFNYHRDGYNDVDLFLNGISLGIEFRSFLEIK